MKVVVIGIDGATWDSVIPHIKSGKLPGYAKFWNEGLHGSLFSTIPYLTQPGWRAYSMGKNPGKMGVYFWVTVDWKNFRLPSINSLGFHGEDYWDILSREGYTVAVIDVPSTFPPKPVNGVMISGFPYGKGSWTYPESFVEKIPQSYPKEATNLFIKNENPEKTMDGIEKEIKSRFDMANQLWDHDLVHVSIIMNDHVSHFMWDNEAIMLRNLQANDKGIQEILEKNKDGYTILMSDHGNGALKDEFFTNEYFKNEGLFFVKEQKSSITREQVVNVGTKLGLHKLFKHLPTGIQEKVINRVRGIDSGLDPSLEKNIDWKKTRAIALDLGPIYINPLYEDEKEDIIDELRKKLTAVKTKDGNRLYKNIFRSSEIYWGEYKHLAPDVLAITDEIYDQRQQLTGYLWSTDIPDEKWSYRLRLNGMHRIKGIFGMVGPGIPTKEISPSIYDLAPTILKLFKCKIPDEMDGKPVI